MGPVLIREMEGVVFRASIPSSANGIKIEEEGEPGAPLAGIILSSSGFSKQALLQVRSSNVPLAAIHVLAQPQSEAATALHETEISGELVERCVSIVWNDQFGSPTQGLFEGGMEVRWARTSAAHGKGVEASMGRPVIYRAGKPLR